MKKLFIISCMAMACSVLHAQEPADALRFSWTVPSGTARQQAIGGAMGSLGGDLSALYVNPAGLAFYKTGDLLISPGYRFGNNKSNYFNRTEKEMNDGKLLLGTSGLVLGSGTNRRGGNAAFAIGFSRTADFNSNILYRGANNQNSYSQKFLDEINNAGLKDANRVANDFPFGTSLAFNTYWIDTVGGSTNGNFSFKTRAPISTGLLQEEQITNTGGIYEFSLGGAATLSDKVMLGGSFGIPILDYHRTGSFTEADATTDTSNRFDFANISENLHTRGTGINLKAGVIFKPTDFIRLGLALHSPTFYDLTDDYDVTVTTNTERYQGLLSDYSKDYTNGAASQFKYSLITPFKAIASISYVLREVEDVRQQRGFLTADVEYVNYKASSFQPAEESTDDPDTKDYLKSLNQAIDNAYKSALNVKVGGELKFTTFMVRAGVAYFSNPYQNIQGEKGSKLNVSGGLGYRNKGAFIDLTYVQAMGKDVHFPYRLQGVSYPSAAIKSAVGTVMITVGFKL